MTKLPESIRNSLIRLAFLRLSLSRQKDRLPVFLVPTTTVRRSGIEYICEVLNTCQTAFLFFLTDTIDIRQTVPIKYSTIDLLPTMPKRTARLEFSLYISQLDFYTQTETFLLERYGGSHQQRDPIYISNQSLTILIGREKFIWDDPSPEYVLTGDFNEDGYTILYNNDVSNELHEISSFNNIAALSLTKVTTVPEIDFEVARSGNSDSFFINAKTYIVSNVVHFLAERVFLRTIASEHVAACILNLNWTGGLFLSLASRQFCTLCRAKMLEAGPATRIWNSFSCDEIIENLEGLVGSLERIQQIKVTGSVFKLSAWACFTMFGVSLTSNIVSNYTNDVTVEFLVRKYVHPLEIALASVILGLMFLLGFAVCSWISPGKRGQI